MFYLAAMPQTDDSNSFLTKGWRCFMDQRRQKGRKRICRAQACNIRLLRQEVQTLTVDHHTEILDGRFSEM